jgi:hypothetical protein
MWVAIDCNRFYVENCQVRKPVSGFMSGMFLSSKNQPLSSGTSEPVLTLPTWLVFNAGSD